MWICPECRSIYEDPVDECERDGAPVAEVLAHQTRSRYPLLGKVVGDRYHLIGGLGQGGIGTVYLAQHLHLEQLFAVKFLDVTTMGPEFSDDAAGEYRRDFLKEARVASLIRHESVVRVSDFGEHEGMPFLVMEYVPGPSLLNVLGSKGRFDAATTLNIARRIAEALDAFHERRLVHRDLKPANVILDPRGDGRLTLVDLGLVKDLSGPGGKASTHPLALRGTPGYLAPELVPGWVLSGAGVAPHTDKKVVDARADLYALGVILYELLAGVSPYPDGSNTKIIVYACTRDPIPIESVQPPVKLLPGLADLIYATMNRDPEKRPQTAADFLERLEEVALGPGMMGSWPSLAVGRRAPRPAEEAAAALPQDLEDLEEATVVYDRASEDTPTKTKPAPDFEDQTVEVDPDSFAGVDSEDHTFVQPVDSLPGRTSLGPPRIHTRSSVPESVPVPTPAAPPAELAPRPSLDEAPPDRRVTVVLLIAVFALAGALLFWKTQKPPEPTPQRPVVTKQHDAGPAAVVKISGSADSGASPAPRVDAAPPPVVVDAAPPVVDAAPVVAPKKPKRRHTKRPKRPRPKPKAKTANSLSAMLGKAEAAQRAGRYRVALDLYKRFIATADRRHAQYSTVSNRIRMLEGQLNK